MNDVVAATSSRKLSSLPARTAVFGFLGIAGIFGIIIVVAIAVAVGIIVHDPTVFRKTSTVFQFALAAQLSSYAPICAFVLWMMRRQSPLANLGFRRIKASDLRILAVGTATLLGVCEILSALCEKIIKKPLQPNLFGPHPSLGMFVAVTLMAVVLAPVSEELVFRGLLFNAFRRRLGLWPSAVISAVMFAAVHLEPYAIIPLIGAGLILAVIYERSGNIFVSMISHATLNALAVVETFSSITVRH